MLATALDVGQDAGINYVAGNSPRIAFDTFKLFILTFVYQGTSGCMLASVLVDMCAWLTTLHAGMLELQVILSRPFALDRRHPAHFPKVALTRNLTATTRYAASYSYKEPE